ncbi:MAG: hypothetical protein M1815_002250 [Lichina confinis]|nr:MAG: hypothetical protein M1815_002250 [Lichina confinis]
MDPFVTPAKNLYKDFDKGPEFRAALLNDFKYILRHYICDQHGLNDQAVKDCLGDMIAECTRLYYNPLLFESRDLEDKFFKEVNDIVSGISEYIKDERKDRQADLKMARLAGRIWEKETRPLYKPGKTPWGQFLENGAPGSGIASVVPGPLLTMQVVPPAGSELYFLWRKAAAQLKFCIKSVGSDAD